MNIKIGHVSIDENGTISGGKVGDQTGKEICVREWYNKHWNVYLECTAPALAEKAAKYMEQICADPNYGYDQSQRWTGYNAILKNGGKVAGAKGGFDCSSLVIACYILAGLKIKPEGYTGNIKNILLATGKFKVYIEAAYLTSGIYAKRGGIYLLEGHHVVMALEDGEGNKKNPYKKPLTTVTKKSLENVIRWLQFQLNKALKSVSGYIPLEVDGKYGNHTTAAVRKFYKLQGWKSDGTKVGIYAIGRLAKY